ncbi:MAG: NAD-dependent epimerase/dehydratase family protein [Candidatus Latescibacteria bacterium]|nr:NAD-dependent epimerase/dehydratase family protein [Candidatus Latescibacterota bacterium]
MKRVLLTGVNGTVAQVMKKELAQKYEISGISIPRMDQVLAQQQPATWKDQFDAFCSLVTQELTAACKGQDAVVHLGWNTRDENWRGGLDPLNIAVVDCVYRVAIAEKVPRIYLASSVHSYDYIGDNYDKDVPAQPFPDTRQDPYGVPPTSLYGVSKRWMEIAGQYYAPQLAEGQKILVVRLGAVNHNEKPRRASRLWNSHRDCAGLLEAFIENEDAPPFSIAYSVSDNHAAGQSPLFDTINPFGFVPADNAHQHFPNEDKAS